MAVNEELMFNPSTHSSVKYEPITPHDTNSLQQVTRAITVGVAGALTVIRLDGTSVTLALPVGTHAMATRRVMATGTDADDLTAWY